MTLTISRLREIADSLPTDTFGGFSRKMTVFTSIFREILALAIEALDRRSADTEVERCIACDLPLEAGQLVLDDASGGIIHRECCGPEREAFTGEDGGPLKDGEPIPEGWQWEPDRSAADTEVEKLVEALRPFAEALKDNYHHQHDTFPIWAGFGATDLRFALKLGDFRRAREALASLDQGEEMSKLSYAQEAVFAHLSEQSGITCSEAIRLGANGRTLSAMTDKGWLFDVRYAAGLRVWELTTSGSEIARQLLAESSP